APTLVLSGRHDVQFPWQAAEAASRRIPESRFAAIEDAGHFPMVERPRETAQLISEFLGAKRGGLDRRHRAAFGFPERWAVKEGMGMGNDSVQRCELAPMDPALLAYHDTEWGVPEHDDRKLFEFLVLEGAQAGLSWLTVLKKRENFRKALDGFD